jgi:hypothetical protein
MKKKSIFNNNEVDIDLLVNQPKHIRKMLGKKKDEDEEDENETEEEGDEEDKNKSLSPQMKQYINDFIDSKKVKKKERQKGIVEKFIEKHDKPVKLPLLTDEEGNDKLLKSYREYEDDLKKGKVKPVIQKYYDKYFKTKK